MKRIILILILVVVTLFQSNAQQNLLNRLTGGLRYNEGLVVYNNKVLASNFGTDNLDPLNTEGQGYIVSISDNKVKMLIPADGYMSAPKGMAVHQNHLFVADVNKVLIYNLKRIGSERPRIIPFPEGEDFVNDIAVLGDLILVTVTNTGNIYALDATEINVIGSPALVGNVPGANGLVVGEGYVYCASYSPDGSPSPKNVIYYADMIAGAGRIEIKPLIKDLPAGQYDGVTLSEDGKTLYFSSWAVGDKVGTIYRYELDGNTPVRQIDFGVKFGGPADICILDGMLYIPDLVESALYRFAL